MAESQDVNTLKRRGRRRLAGSIALVLAAVIVLPWIFDPQPRQTPPVSVRIPNEDESAFKPEAVPKPAPPRQEMPKTEAKPEALQPQSQPEAKPAPAPEKKPAQSAAERARAEAALANVQYVFQVGAYADPEDVIAKLKAAKIPHYTEPVATEKGTVTRVRAGPFGSREAAERALKRIKALGFKPGGVTTRS
ncbi:MAG: SPOR domain-containing protein [Burkholderiales bacterium]